MIHYHMNLQTHPRIKLRSTFIASILFIFHHVHFQTHCRAALQTTFLATIFYLYRKCIRESPGLINSFQSFHFSQLVLSFVLMNNSNMIHKSTYTFEIVLSALFTSFLSDFLISIFSAFPSLNFSESLSSLSLFSRSV